MTEIVRLSFGHDILGQPLYMCCLCFYMFYPHQLYRDEDGDLWDLCRPCQALDSAQAYEVG